MRKMKLAFIVLMCLAFIPVFTAPSFGWEFKMTGSMNWYYEYFNQMGSRVSSGRTMLITELAQQPAILIFGGRVFALIAQNLATGADAGGVYFMSIMDPVLTINPAINLKGRYRLGQWNNPHDWLL